MCYQDNIWNHHSRHSHKDAKSYALGKCLKKIHHHKAYPLSDLEMQILSDLGQIKGMLCDYEFSPDIFLVHNFWHPCENGNNGGSVYCPGSTSSWISSDSVYGSTSIGPLYELSLPIALPPPALASNNSLGGSVYCLQAVRNSSDSGPSKNGDGYEWVSQDESESICYSSEDVEGLSTNHDLCVGGDCIAMLQQTSAVLKVIPHVKVFARVAPAAKEVLILTNYKTVGRITLMCGDGTNDAAEAQRQKLKKLMDELNEDGGDGRSTPIVKLGDASMASPFTTKHASVAPTADIIRQGRSTLVTTLQMFKILGLNCFATAYV
ncbi:hypothetical protein Vadar_008717 [Vaccinium darrowii]|uniref:Uncharacterized protein n=1 Tax=Vaccinium darrowii TaxID=229202 RepID=A0ACB7YVV4_9ERIC|nr:hypothetical protein Vadar_008717 [Vaccinium darrowii]